MNDNQLLELIERYLNGEMSQEERAGFEKLRKEHAGVENRLAEHKAFLSAIKQYSERLDLEKRLNAIHDEIDVHTLKEEVTVRPSWIIQLWRNHHSKISVAASVAIFAILLTMFFTGYFNKNEHYIEQLVRRMGKLEKTQNSINGKTNAIYHKFENQASFGGTGFAISSDGYIITNAHVVKGADSIYVQNEAGEAFKAIPVKIYDPNLDLAVLKIVDTSFRNLGPLPYTFKKSKSDLGENVYTLGYPRESQVFDEGYLSSSTGAKGDTASYQVSLPVNNGNSGGPLLDNRGNVIGVITSKETYTEGAAFAIKSSYLIKAIQSDTLAAKASFNTNKNMMAGLSRPQQVRKLQNYVFMVKVFSH